MDVTYDQLLARLSRGSGATGSPPVLSETRARYDAMAESMVAEGVEYDESELDARPALWARPAGRTPSRLVVYVHGGGYVAGSARAYRAMLGHLAVAADATCVSFDYRLAPEAPFPAAVDDCVSVYRRLLERRDPAQIALAGDSAGGGLVFATMLRARKDALPMPSAGYGLSVWGDLEGTGGSFTSKAATDPVMTAEGARGCAAAYLQGHPGRDPLVSPVHADLTGFPPLLLQVGSTEMFLDDSIRLARRAGEADVRATLEIWPGAFHVWARWASVLSEGRAALESAGRFLRTHVAE